LAGKKFQFKGFKMKKEESFGKIDFVKSSPLLGAM
jgi:hypothetical protein